MARIRGEIASVYGPGGAKLLASRGPMVLGSVHTMGVEKDHEAELTILPQAEVVLCPGGRPDHPLLRPRPLVDPADRGGMEGQLDPASTVMSKYNGGTRVRKDPRRHEAGPGP